jgi:hypothetical protein
MKARAITIQKDNRLKLINGHTKSPSKILFNGSKNTSLDHGSEEIDNY